MYRLNIAILPAGAWGTALAIPLSDNNHQVKLYFRQPKDANYFNKYKKNTKRLPKIKFNGQVKAIASLKEAIQGQDILILACDSVHLRSFFKNIQPFLSQDTKILCVSKGIEKETNLGMLQLLCELEPKISSRLAVMSGPNFAKEVAERFPTMTVVASKNPQVGKILQKALTTKNFRVYTQQDVLGVELGGALKNVIAIGVGIGDGLKMGENIRAALITRGVSEMIKVGDLMGANKSTFIGLSGLGDLILCCTSDKSRNHQAGFLIGQGTDPKNLLNSGQTIEGFHTIKAVISLAKKGKIKIPIMEMVYKIVYENLKPKKAFEELMKVELNSENEV